MDNAVHRPPRPHPWYTMTARELLRAVAAHMRCDCEGGCKMTPPCVEVVAFLRALATRLDTEMDKARDGSSYAKNAQCALLERLDAPLLPEPR